MCWAPVWEASLEVALKGQAWGWGRAFEAGLPISLTGLFSPPTFPSPHSRSPSPQLRLLTAAFSGSQFFLPSIFIC